MKKFAPILFLSSLLLLLAGCRAAKKVESDSRPISHEKWDELLQKHVDETGKVNYKGFIADSLELNEYLDLVSRNHPNDANWSDAEQMAYWFNAYNAYTVQIVIRNYPVESIKDIADGVAIPFVSTVWDYKFIQIEGHDYDLNNIEHNILRKYFEEPRMHFALVCASYSCPRLLNQAYSAEKLDEQLDLQAKNFLADSRKNKINSPDSARLSKIFSWYKGDFTKNQSLVAFLNQFLETPLNEDADIEFMEYDWSLNE